MDPVITLHSFNFLTNSNPWSCDGWLGFLPISKLFIAIGVSAKRREQIPHSIHHS